MCKRYQLSTAYLPIKSSSLSPVGAFVPPQRRGKLAIHSAQEENKDDEEVEDDPVKTFSSKHEAMKVNSITKGDRRPALSEIFTPVEGQPFS